MNTAHQKLRGLRFSRRGSFYIPFVALFLVLFLILAFIQIQVYFNPTSDDFAGKRITRDLGGKQGEILRSVREGERIRTYVEQSAALAQRGTASGYVCGQPYLNYYVIGQGTCDQTPSSFANNIFNTALAEYPKGSLATMFGEPTTTQQASGIILEYEGTYRIPIAGGEIAGQTATGGSAGASGTFSGSLENWPTPDPRITSIFGKRDLSSQSGSRNHAGIDIGTRQRTGEPISSLTDGIASFYPDGQNSLVVVDSGAVVFEYVHVSPGGLVGNRKSVPVKAGNIIAVNSPYANGEHLHLQVYVKDIQRNTVESIPAWRGHIGASDTAPNGLTYAVIKTTTNKAYLDPLCFFDRAFVDQKVRASSIDWYARRSPNSLYETCDVYERDLGLSRRFGSIGSTSSVVSTASTPTIPTAASTPNPNTPPSTTNSSTDPTASAAPINPAQSTNERVRRTYDNLERQNLITVVQEEASKGEFDPAILFALITQESEGVADAVSPTGCVGIGQFCYSTAQNYNDLFPQLTRCACTGAACRDENTRQCNPRNDGRFNAENSVRASARLIGGHIQRYKQYDQKEALALIAYNAGPGVVNQVLAKAGTNPSWSQMRAILQTDTSINYGDGIDPTAKRIEVVAYVDRITQTYIPAWGGSFISGGSYTSDIPGFYTLNLALRIDLTKTASVVIEQIEESIADCATEQCIRERVVTTARANNAQAKLEPLNGDTGCMSSAERAQAYLANQFLYCKRSPDDACGCSLFEGTEAKYTVTPTQTRITERSGTAVNPTAFPSMPGLAFERGGDGTSMSSVIVLKSLSDEESARDSTREDVDLVLSEKNDEKRLALALRPDLSIDALWKSDKYGGLALARGDLTETNQCVLPNSLRVQAYCLTSSDDRFEPTVFYVDMRANSTPNYLARQYDTKGSGGGIIGAVTGFFGSGSSNVRFFTDEQFPYARITAVEMIEGVPREETFYYRIVPSQRDAYTELSSLLGSLGYSSIAKTRVIERYQGRVGVLEPSVELKYLHEVHLPPVTNTANKEFWLVLLDNNLREGARMKIDVTLTKETSGFVIPKPEDVIPGIPIPGIT